MILFLTTCNDCFLLKLFNFVKMIINFTFLILPIILIVLISIDLGKCVIANKDDEINKAKKIAIKRIIYCVAAFFVPTIVNITMSLIHDFVDEENKSTTLSCWVAANNETVKNCTIDIPNDNNSNNNVNSNNDNNNNNNNNNNSNSNSNNNSNNSSSNNQTNNNSASNNNQNNNSNTNNTNYTIYVGDSRTVGMCNSVKMQSNEECLAEVGMGYNWLKQTALPNINNKLNTYKNANVVINLGVNDLGTTNDATINNYANNYAKIYNGIANNYPSAKIIIVSVGTSDSEKKQEDAVNNKYLYSVIRNSSVNKFNSTLEKSLLGNNIKFCNINNALNNKYKTVSDGLHYTNETYQNIYNEIKKCL